MKKSYLLLLLCFGFLSMKAPQKEISGHGQKFSYNDISRMIMKEFPMAYKEFMEISFYRRVTGVVPGTATFLVPATYFESELTQKVLNEKAKAILDKMGKWGGPCPEIFAGETEEYEYLEWKDKKVKKVTLLFYIGC